MQAAARARDRHVPARRRRRTRSRSTCASSRPPTAIRRRRSRTGTLREDLYLPARTSSRSCCRRCATATATSSCSPSTSSHALNARRRRDQGVSRAPRCELLARTAGPATCASCATRCSAPTSWPTTIVDLDFGGLALRRGRHGDCLHVPVGTPLAERRAAADPRDARPLRRATRSAARGARHQPQDALQPPAPITRTCWPTPRPSADGIPPTMIRILIADDHAIVRAGLKQFIADQPDMTVAGEASTGTEAVQLVRDTQFDVVLFDISMPDRNGIDTLKTLRQIRPELPVLMLSGFAEDQYAVNLLRAGAAGYLNKEAASTPARAARYGRWWRGRKFRQSLARADPRRRRHRRRRQAAARRGSRSASSRSSASSRRGRRCRRSPTNCSSRSRHRDRTRVLEKMGMKSNADLTYYAIKNGLIE